MRPLSLNFRLWHLMAAVAGFALALREPRALVGVAAFAVIVSIWRLAAYHKRAYSYANLEREFLWKLARGEGDDPSWDRACAEHYALMRARYAVATRKPWSTLGTEPPLPCRSIDAEEMDGIRGPTRSEDAVLDLDDPLSFILIELEESQSK